MDINNEGDALVHAAKWPLHARTNPLLRLVNLKLTADTGVKAVSFSYYWYNLFLQFPGTNDQQHG
jgi:hypothetical protein